MYTINYFGWYLAAIVPVPPNYCQTAESWGWKHCWRQGVSYLVQIRFIAVPYFLRTVHMQVVIPMKQTSWAFNSTVKLSNLGVAGRLLKISLKAISCGQCFIFRLTQYSRVKSPEGWAMLSTWAFLRSDFAATILSTTARSWTRCDHHEQVRCDYQEEVADFSQIGAHLWSQNEIPITAAFLDYLLQKRVISSLVLRTFLDAPPWPRPETC